jgi:benzoate 4-monooxygenase
MEAPLLPLTKALFAWHPYKRAGADFDNIILHNSNKRIRKPEASGDIFSKLQYKNNGEPINLPWGELLAECSVMMNAGTDTTTAALTNMIYLLYKHPEALRRLREELDGAFGPGIVPTYEIASRLPFLRACIEESLRLRPASSMGLPRVVPKGGRMIAGRFFREGVTVSVPTYTLLRSESVFENPEVFKPQRWIDGDKERMAKAHFPFSTGPRACIGRNIAYYEQILVISTLVRNFSFDFESPDYQLRTIERFNSNPGDLILTGRLRSEDISSW